MPDLDDYTPPLGFGKGVEIDTTPDSDGDLEIYTPDGDHFTYLSPEDQIKLRDLLNKIHPPGAIPFSRTIVLHGGPKNGATMVITQELEAAGFVRVEGGMYVRKTKFEGPAATCEVRVWNEWHYEGKN